MSEWTLHYGEFQLSDDGRAVVRGVRYVRAALRSDSPVSRDAVVDLRATIRDGINGGDAMTAGQRADATTALNRLVKIACQTSGPTCRIHGTPLEERESQGGVPGLVCVQCAEQAWVSTGGERDAQDAQDREHDMDLAYAKGWNDAREGGIEVEVVSVGTHETKDGGWYASFTIICEDETLDEIDDLPNYGVLLPRP